MHKTADELLSIAGQNTRNPAPSDPQARQGGSVGEFVSAYAPLAAKVGGEMGVDPSILLGQWGHETGWGKSVIPGTNNLGNIKDFSGRGVAATDNMTGSKDRYRAYGTPDDFGSDFLGLMSRKFQGAYGAGADPVKYAQALKDGGYAEDPNYVAGIQAATNKVRSIAGQLFPKEQKPFQRDLSDTPSVGLNLDATYAEIDRKANRGLMDAAADGLKRGFVQSQALTGGLAAFAGDAVGSEGLKQWGLDLYKRKMDESAKYSQNASFMDMWEGKRDTGAVPWAIDSLTYLGYQVFEGLVTGGVGALAGKAIGKAAIQSTLKGLVTSEVGNLSEKFLAEQVAKGLTKDAAQAAMTDTVKSQIGKQAAENAAGKMANAAQATAMFANNFRQEAGSIYGEAAEAGKTDNRLGEIFAWSIGAALADTGPEYLMQKQVLGGAGTKGFSGSYPARVAKAAALDSSMQGATEGVQTLMEQKGAGKEVGTPESWRDVIDSVAPAMLGGVAVAPAAGRHRAQPAIDPAIQAAAEQPHSPLARAVVASQMATLPAQDSAEQFRARPDVLPAGSFSQQNELADLIQQEKADQSQRLTVQDTGPFANREPRQRIEQAPRGNFAQQSEFADLLNNEKADLQQRRDALAQTQFAKAKLQFESDLESADARVAAGDMDRVQRDRLGILQGMLEDPQALTASPEFAVSAFMEQLTGRGVRNPSLTPEEQRIMGRFFDVRDAVDTTEQTIPSAPNELDAANAGIREAAAPQVQQASAGIRPGVMKAAQQPGNRIKGNQVLNRNGQRIARLNEAEQAAIAQSSQSPAENQPQVYPASEQVSADVSPIERISDASLNSEAQNVVSGDVPNSIQISETNEAPEQNSAEAVSPENNAQAVAPDVVQRLKDMARAWDFANRSSRNNEWQGGTAEASRSFNAIAEAGSRIPAHGMSKEATLSGGIDSLIRMLTGGIDPNRILFYDALSAPKGHSSGGATAGGVAYRDGPFIITLAEGLNGRQPTSDDILGVLVNPAHSEIVEPLQQMFPNLVIRDYFDVADVVAASRSVGASDNSAQDVNPPVVDSIPAGLDYMDWKKATGRTAPVAVGTAEHAAEKQAFDAYRKAPAQATASPSPDYGTPSQAAPNHESDTASVPQSYRNDEAAKETQAAPEVQIRVGDFVTFPVDADGHLDIGEVTRAAPKMLTVLTESGKVTIGRQKAAYLSKLDYAVEKARIDAQWADDTAAPVSVSQDQKSETQDGLSITGETQDAQQSNTHQVTEASSGNASGEVIADTKVADQEEPRVITPGSELDQRAEAWDASVDAMTQDEARALYEAMGLASARGRVDEKAVLKQEHPDDLDAGAAALNAPAAHQDTGQPPESVTPAVVAESVQKSADNTPRNIKEARQWILDAVDAAIAKAPTEAVWKKLKNNDASTITFDVPGDGKFKVLNHKERLKAFRAQVSASAGFKAPAKNLPTIQRDSNPGNYSVRDFLKDGDYLTAYQFAQDKGDPLRFGAQNEGKAPAPLVYSDAETLELHDGIMGFVGRSLDGGWQVIEEQTGLSFASGGNKAEAISKARRDLTTQQIAKLHETIKTSPKRSQEQLETEWLAWAEGAQDQKWAQNEVEYNKGPSSGARVEMSLKTRNHVPDGVDVVAREAENAKNEAAVQAEKAAAATAEDSSVVQSEANPESLREAGARAFADGKARDAWTNEPWAKSRTASLTSDDWRKGYDAAKTEATETEQRIKYLYDQLSAVENELHAQGRVQNARTRAKADDLRAAIEELKRPEIFKAVGKVPAFSESVGLALDFMHSSETPQDVVLRALKNKGVVNPYLSEMTDRVMAAIGEPVPNTEPAAPTVDANGNTAEVTGEINLDRSKPAGVFAKGDQFRVRGEDRLLGTVASIGSDGWLYAMDGAAFRPEQVKDDLYHSTRTKQEKGGFLDFDGRGEVATAQADGDLSAMFDQILAEETGAKPKRERKPRDPNKPATPRKPRTAGAAASSAAKNTAEGLNAAITGLAKLFGGNGKLSSGMTFDEETYAKAKPLFIQAAKHLAQAGADIADVMRAVVRMVVGQAGAQAAGAMKPYVIRFAEDVKSGNINYDENVEDYNSGEGNHEHSDAGEQGPETLDEMATGEDAGVGQGGATAAGNDSSGRAGNGGSEVADGSGLSGSGSRGSGSEEIHSAEPGAGGAGKRGRGRGKRKAGEGVSGDTRPVHVATTVPAINFKITDDVRLGQGSEDVKFRDNLDAIRVLKDIEHDKRRATPEEQRTLARYVGWGGLKNAFADNEGGFKPGWEDRGAELRDALMPGELADARNSTQAAHYTSQTVVNAMWAAAQRLGFAGGSVLEPSVGTGNFIGLMPDPLRGNARVVAVEKDSLTARIAKALYPQSTVLHSPFERVTLPDNSVDLAIGNPPFGRVSLNFRMKPELRGASIHNQFFMASLDAVRPGGLQIMVVSRYLMDAKTKATREALAAQAELVAAIRLPDSAFQENARTQVVTDILVLRKRSDSETAEILQALNERGAREPARMTDKERQERRDRARLIPDWIDVGVIPDPLGSEPIEVNKYFINNPRQILGTLERSGGMQFDFDEDGNKVKGINVKLRDGASMPELLEAAIARLPEGIAALPHDAIAESLESHERMTQSLELSLSGKEDGDVLFDDDGNLSQIYERETREGGYALARRALTPDSPWSSALVPMDDGRWYRNGVSLDANGKPKKKAGKDGKPSKLNEYEREYFTEDNLPDGSTLGKAKYERLVKLVRIRDAMKNQLVLESEGAASEVMEANRSELSGLYGAFVEKHGLINDPSNADVIDDMPDGALVMALEISYKPEISASKAKKSGTKARKSSAKRAAILDRRVVMPYMPPGKADNIKDAIAINLSESGRIGLGRLASLLGLTEDGVIDLANKSADDPVLFFDPESETWETRDAYLSGNVRKKLAAAKEQGLMKNVSALEAVQPEPWGAENVTARIGAAWVPGETYAEFLKHLIGGDTVVTYAAATNSFDVFGTKDSQKSLRDWGTKDIPAPDLLARLLNSSPIVVTRTDSEGHTYIDKVSTAEAQIKGKEVVDAFAEWIFADADRRQMLVSLFNDKFNTRVTRQHDGAHMTLPGKVPDEVISMHSHQKNAVWRGVVERFLLIDHAVGAGKTFTSIARAMERRRMGISRKPAIVVPNHMVQQFTSDVYRLYPGAKVMAAGSADFTAKNRRKLLAKIASGDWDVVIIPHSSFGFVGISQETEERYLREELELAESAISDAEEEAKENGLDSGWRKPFNVAQAEAMRDKIAGCIQNLQNRTKDRLLTFEQMGIDDLTIDEAHEFKNLFYHSRLTNVRGMGSRAGSQKAFDIYNKVRVLRETGGSVCFMTGTPISNSAVEMYNLMRMLAADDLRDAGMEHFDAWRAQFVEATTKYEPNEAGQLKEVNRLGRTWSNMRNLMEMYYSFTDAVTNEDIKKWYAEKNGGAKFPLPDVKGGERQSIVIAPTKAQEGLLDEVLAGFEGLPGIEDVKERNAERLRLMDRARKLSLDARAVNPHIESDEKGGKLDRVSDEVTRIYKEAEEDKGTQLVFLDRSVPKAKGDDTKIRDYDKLRTELDAALATGDEVAYQAKAEALEKFDEKEINELRAARQGGWNAYAEIKRKLIARGIPAEEIRFVQEANSDEEKKALFDAVNSGEVRVLIGSTPRMGAGTNVQERLVGLHHVDVTWKPSDIEQREGRIIRQGNSLLEKYGDAFDVEILAYATERTVDAKMWDLNATKLKMINGIRKYNGEFTMDFPDEDSLGMAAMAALASGDPKLLERVELMAEIETLELQERAHQRREWGVRDDIARSERVIETYPLIIQRVLDRASFLTEQRRALRLEANARTVTVEGKQCSSHFEVMKAAEEAIAAQRGGNENGRYSIKVGDARVTSKEALEDAIRRTIGDVEPLSVEVTGQNASGETKMAVAFSRALLSAHLAEIATKAAKELAINGASSQVVGKMLGMDLELDVEQRAFSKKYSYTLSVTRDGVTVRSADIAEASELPTFSASALRGTFSKLEEYIAYESWQDASSFKKDLERAKSELPELKAREGKQFAKADELAEKRKRFNEVTLELAGSGKKVVSDSDVDAVDTTYIPKDTFFRRTPASRGEPAKVALVRTASAFPFDALPDVQLFAFSNKRDKANPWKLADAASGEIVASAEKRTQLKQAMTDLLEKHGVERIMQVLSEKEKISDSEKLAVLYPDAQQVTKEESSPAQQPEADAPRYSIREGSKSPEYHKQYAATSVNSTYVQGAKDFILPDGTYLLALRDKTSDETVAEAKRSSAKGNDNPDVMEQDILWGWRENDDGSKTNEGRKLTLYEIQDADLNTVGYALLGSTDGRIDQIANIVLEPQYRRGGLGRKIVGALLNESPELDLHWIKDNDALAAWQALGSRDVEVEGHGTIKQEEFNASIARKQRVSGVGEERGRNSSEGSKGAGAQTSSAGSSKGQVRESLISDSLRQAPTWGMTMQDLRAVTQPIIERLTGRRVTLLQNGQSLPAEILSDMESRNIDPWQVEGVFHQGELFLIADNLSNPDRAISVLMHEATHYGLRGIFGRGLDPVLMQIGRTNKAALAYADEYVKRYSSDTHQVPMVVGVEEYMASLSESERKKLNGWEKFVAYVRQWLRSKGWPSRIDGLRKWVDRMTDADVELLIHQSLDFWQNGGKVKHEWVAGVVYNAAVKSLRDVAEAATNPSNNENAVATISMVSDWAASAIHDAIGVDVSGYRHTADAYAVRHILKSHGDEAREAGRGQIALSVQDLPAMAETVLTPDSLILGLKNKRGQDLVFSVKAMPDGTMLVVEEVRTGKKSLAVESARKVPGAKNAKELIPSVLLNARNDAGVDPIVVDSPAANKPSYSLRDDQGPEDDGPKGGDEFPAIINPDARYSISEAATRNQFHADTINRLTDAVKTLAGPSTKTLSFLHNIQTQLHKALTIPEFGAVVSQIEKWSNQTKRSIHNAASRAPDILREYGSFGETVKSVKSAYANAKHMPRVWKMLEAGTLNGDSVLEGKVFSPDELRSQFGATPEEIALYGQARAAIDAGLDESAASIAWATSSKYLNPTLRDAVTASPASARYLMRDAFEQAIEEARSDMDPALQEKLEQAAEQAESIFQKAEELKDAGYTPLMRFGKFTLTVQDEDGNTAFFNKYETDADRKLAQAELEKDIQPGQKIIAGVMNDEAHKLYQGINPDSVALFLDKIGDTEDLGLPPELMDAVRQEWLKVSVSERSALARTIHRKGTPGFSTDLERVLSSFVTSSARMAAKNYYNKSINEAITDIPKEMGDVQKEAQQLKAYIDNPEDPFVAVRGLMFAWYLGGSVASATVNLTQIPMVTFPFLSQWGIRKASVALMYGARAAMGKNQNLPREMVEALQRASDEGKVEPNEVHHVLSAGMDSIFKRLPGGKTVQAVGKAISTAWGLFFGFAESFNRRATFIAAYKMATDSPNILAEGQSAYDFAKSAVDQTQFVNDKYNRPNWARGTGAAGVVGAAAFTFKQFSISYVELLTRLMTAKNPDGTRNLDSIKAGGLMLGLMFLAAGANGMPGADDLDDLLDTIMQALGYNGNAKHAKREFFVGMLGKDLGEVFLSGVSSMTPVDLTRMGMSNLAPATGVFKNTERDRRGRQLMEVLGAPASLAAAPFDAVDALQRGKYYDALTDVLPGAAKNVLKGAGMLSSGQYRDAKGRNVGAVDGLDAAMKAAGFQPQRIASGTRISREIQQDVARVRNIRADANALAAEGQFEHDDDLKMRAKEMLAEWNSRYPDAKISLNDKSIAARVRAMQMDRTARTTKAAPKNMQSRVAAEMEN